MGTVIFAQARRALTYRSSHCSLVGSTFILLGKGRRLMQSPWRRLGVGKDFVSQPLGGKCHDQATYLQAVYEITGCRSQRAMLPAKFWKQPLAKGNSRERNSNRQCIEARPKRFLAPFMIHEDLPTLTETAFGSHPCCVVSVTYVRTHCFHGGNTGSNPVGDAN